MTRRDRITGMTNEEVLAGYEDLESDDLLAALDVTDIDAVPPGLLGRARADIEAHASAKAQAGASSET